jgi:hypothetical protein
MRRAGPLKYELPKGQFRISDAANMARREGASPGQEI